MTPLHYIACNGEVDNELWELFANPRNVNAKDKFGVIIIIIPSQVT